MALKFQNNYHREIWTMVERYQPSCSDGSNWVKEGWWRIGPGESATVFGGDPSAVNATWYCYAYAGDGVEWRDRFRETVPHQAFEWCANTSDPTSREILMNEFVVSRPNHTHSFNP